MLSTWPRTKGSLARRLQRVSGPNAEPISFQLQQASLKVGNLNSSQFVIAKKIGAARNKIESVIRRKLVQQVWDMFLDTETYVGSQPDYYPWFANGPYSDVDLGKPEITLPFPPTQSVLGIYTTDWDGVETLVDPSVYFVTGAKEPCRIRLNIGQVWPPHRGPESMRVRFSCGYSTPFTVGLDPTGTILAENHGYTNGSTIQFSSTDGTLPAPLQTMADYTVTNLTENGFQVKDSAGNMVTPVANWTGSGFIGVVPDDIVYALALLSGMGQAGEVASRLPGVSQRLSPIETPIDPAELIVGYIWPEL